MELINPCFNNKNEKIFVYEKKNIEPYKENNSKSIIVYKKSIPIQIHKETNDMMLSEYSLSTHFFDPTKSSPPNDFLLKLYARIDKYQKKEINLCSE